MSGREAKDTAKMKRETERALRAERWREAGYAANPGSAQAEAAGVGELKRSLAAVAGSNVAGALVESLPRGNEVIELLKHMALQTLDPVFMEAARAMQAHGLDGADYREKLEAMRPSERDFGIAVAFRALIDGGKSKREASEIIALEYGIVSAGFDGACEEVIRTDRRVTQSLMERRAREIAAGMRTDERDHIQRDSANLPVSK